MSLRYDLHSHSILSDGTLEVAELVTRAHGNGVDALALTDHDVTAGLDEAVEVAAALGMTLVPGVEISVTWNHRTVHVVGLHIDHCNGALQSGLETLRSTRDARAIEIGARLAARGIEGALEGSRRLAKGPIISRTHFARFLVAAGHAKDLRQAFKRYMSDHAPAAVAGQWATLAEAVGWITGAGGQAVIAHPGRYKLGRDKLMGLCDEFIACGGTGIEVVCGSHGPKDYTRFAQVAQETGLRASVGSDYHGPEQVWLDLGKLAPLPPGCTPIWADW